MAIIELPHTAGCLVCGRSNPHGLHLSLHVDDHTGQVTTRWRASPEQIGFEGIVHGGVLATVLDEAMVWAATWAGRRFCVCGEMTVRYRESAGVGDDLIAVASVEAVRSRLIATVAQVRRAADDRILVEAGGKYVPVPPERNRQFLQTLVDEPATAPAAKWLRPP
jgi:acyl-coenzyme A thioesterase PaaI-like protein